MKNNKRLLKSFTVFGAVLIAAFFLWNNYMQSSWDNHIVIQASNTFSIQHNNQKPSVVSKEKFENLPEFYKKPIEIVEADDQYLWVNNNNKKLIKTIIQTPPYKQGGRMKEGEKHIIFEDQEKTVRITIKANNYIGTYGYTGNTRSCDPNFRLNGNVQVEHTLEKGTILKSLATIPVYENFQQYTMCGFQLFKG